MASLGISDAAFGWIGECIGRSSIQDPVIVFIAKSAPVRADRDVVRALQSGDIELARKLELQRTSDNSPPSMVVPNVESRQRFPKDALIEGRGIVFAFPAHVIPSMDGWSIDRGETGIVIKDAAGNVKELFGPRTFLGTLP